MSHHSTIKKISFELPSVHGLEPWTCSLTSQDCVHMSRRFPGAVYVAHTFAETPAGSLLRIHPKKQPLFCLCNTPSIIIGGLTGKGWKDNFIRIPFSASSVSTIGTGWLRGCEAALSYYCAWLLLSTTQHRQYSTQRAWGMNSKYEALDFFFNLVSFSLICVLYPSPSAI